MSILPTDVARLRLIHQQVERTRFTDPGKLVAWMGAMQAQDPAMARWAVALRTGAKKELAIQKALNKGDIIRTHVLRPTWHFVSGKDVSWMLALTAPYIRRSLIARQRELELTPTILKKSYTIMEKALAGGIHLTREALIEKLASRKIATHDQRAAYILLHAELERIICSGAMTGTKATYGLFAERVRVRETYPQEEALAKLALKYFQSHGPATLQDFVWWSGLPVTEAKKSIDSVKRNLHSEKIGEQAYWFKGGKNVPGKEASVHLLPAFDEFIISYKDRSACLPPGHHSSTISINGIFYPVVVVNGRVVGTWKRTLNRNKTIVKIEYFPKGKAHKTTEIQELLRKAEEGVKEFFEREDVA